MAIHFVSLSPQEKQEKIKKAISYWHLRRLQDYSPTELDEMSGYNVAGKILENSPERLLLEIEGNPYVIPADLNEKYRIIEGIHQRTMWESPYAQELKFGSALYHCLASAGCAIILRQMHGDRLGCIATLRIQPDNISYIGSWNITIGAARYNPKENGLGEHLDMVSTTKRRVLNDYAVIHRKYNKLIVPREYGKWLVDQQKQKLLESAGRKIKGISLGIKKAPTDIAFADSHFLHLNGEKEIQVLHNGEIHTRKKALPVLGESLQDLNLVKAIEITVPDFDNLILYDLQEKGRTGESLNRVIALFELDSRTYKPILDDSGQPKIITAYQSGIPVDSSRIPSTINLVPSLKAVFANLQNNTDLYQAA